MTDSWDFSGDIGFRVHCLDWFLLGVLVSFRLAYIIDVHLNEIMCFSIKLPNLGVPDESLKEDASAEELKNTDEAVETTEASMYLEETENEIWTRIA